jgi:hypothetical protein
LINKQLFKNLLINSLKGDFIMHKINLDLSILDKKKLEELDLYIITLKDPVESLINVLHKAQTLFGYIPTNQSSPENSSYLSENKLINSLLLEIEILSSLK